MTFLGMMFGGYIWGTLGDVLGRKRILISALLFNALFAILCGISQSFYSLMIFRFLSGIGYVFRLNIFEFIIIDYF